MARPKRIKQQASTVPIPQSREETVDAIARIGALQRDRQRIEADMNDELAAAKEKYENQAAPLNDEIRDLSRGVQAWCEANRASLTQGGKVKHANLASGEIKWRTRPPRVIVRGTEAVIELLKKLGLGGRFVRTKDEINKEAILAGTTIEEGKVTPPKEIAAVPGIRVEAGEDFVIVPFESALEQVI